MPRALTDGQLKQSMQASLIRLGAVMASGAALPPREIMRELPREIMRELASGWTDQMVNFF